MGGNKAYSGCISAGMYKLYFIHKIILYKVSILNVVIYRWLQKYIQVIRLMASDHVAFVWPDIILILYNVQVFTGDSAICR